MWDTLWSVTLLYAGNCPTCGIRYEVGLCCVQGTVQHVGYIVKCDSVVCRGLSNMWDTLWSGTVLCAGDCPACRINYEVWLCCIQGTVQHVGYIMKCHCAVCVVCRGLSSMWDTLWSVTVLYAGDCPTCGIRYEVSLCCVQGTVQHVGYVMKCHCAVCRGLSNMWDTLWSVTVLCAGDCPTCGIHYEVSLYCVQGTAVPDLSSLVITPHNMCPSGTVLLDNCCSQSFFPTSPQAYLIFTFSITSPCLSLYLTSLFTLHYVLHLYLDLTSPLSWPHFTFIVHFPLFHLSVDLTSTLSWPHTTFILISLYLLPGLTSRFIWHHFTFHFASFFVPWSMIVQFVEHQTQKPGALLTWVRFPGVTRDFSPSQLPVQTLLQCLYCPITSVHI